MVICKRKIAQQYTLVVDAVYRIDTVIYYLSFVTSGCYYSVLHRQYKCIYVYYYTAVKLIFHLSYLPISLTAFLLKILYAIGQICIKKLDGDPCRR